MSRLDRSVGFLALVAVLETRTFLETNYPELMGSIANHEPLRAPGKYLDPAKLPELRRAIAFHESKGPRIVSSPTRAVVYGKAGTLVGIMQPGSAKPTSTSSTRGHWPTWSGACGTASTSPS